ncbi:Uncharacterised protein [Chlamydia trachomatis]|nr:Uncharacterised protein [Chlamydia trachomatis]
MASTDDNELKEDSSKDLLVSSMHCCELAPLDALWVRDVASADAVSFPAANPCCSISSCPSI